MEYCVVNNILAYALNTLDVYIFSAFLSISMNILISNKFKLCEKLFVHVHLILSIRLNC